MPRPAHALTLAALLALAGCAKEAAPGAPAAKPAAAGAGAAPAVGEPYTLAIAAGGPWRAGAAGTARLTLTAKPPLHVNPEYPVAFRPEGSEGVRFAAERVPLSAAAKTPCAGSAEDFCAVEFPLSATADQAGPARLAGVLTFSVCSADKCLIEKAPLSLALAVE